MFDKIKFFASNMWAFLLPFIKILMSQMGPILADTAMQIVTTLAESGMSNEAKRQSALVSIASNLEQQGIKVGTSVINMAIEAAVLKMKDSLK